MTGRQRPSTMSMVYLLSGQTCKRLMSEDSQQEPERYHHGGKLRSVVGASLSSNVHGGCHRCDNLSTNSTHESTHSHGINIEKTAHQPAEIVLRGQDFD